jgi:hypothetical protein
MNANFYNPRSYLRVVGWMIVFVGLPITLWACISHPLTQPLPEPEQQTELFVTIAPTRHLDLLFMIDNSMSMKPKQDKMKDQFPNLIEALRDPIDKTLPDLRIAIIDSDLGSGAAQWCKSESGFGDRGRFQMRDAAACGANADARWLEFTKNQNVNFTGDLSKVFGCLASNVGVSGCGYEHQLQSLQWAFYLTDNQDQRAFLRPDAYLGIVILTDEDDCSAPMDSGMFNTDIRTEEGSLRCATRGHQCKDVDLSFPISTSISVPYTSCKARTDATCITKENDTSVQTSCNPLSNIAEIAESIKQLKGGGESADDKILVAGIYGTPRAGDTTVRPYKIDRKPNSRKDDANPEAYDYWSICYDPNFMPSGSGWDQKAYDHGATGGLRIDAFLNEFKPESRLAYSICESDFGPAMAGIGKAIMKKINNLCVAYKLVDTSDEPGLQADCRVTYRKPHVEKDENGNEHVILSEDEGSIPRCDASRKPECWEVKIGNPDGTDTEKDTALRCPAKDSIPSQMVDVVRPSGSTLPEGTRLGMYCRTCVISPEGIPTIDGCKYK